MRTNACNADNCCLFITTCNHEIHPGARLAKSRPVDFFFARSYNKNRSYRLSTQNMQKYYSLDEANQMIPSLQMAFIRIHQMQTQIHVLFKRIKSLGIDFSPGDNVLLMNDTLDEESIDTLSSVKVLLANIQREISSLQNQGCSVSSIEKGSVCWPFQLSEREVMLSWRIGETQVSHWQEDEEHDRRPLSELVECS